MIVREKKFKIPSSVLYSAGGIAFGVVTIALAIQSSLTPDSVATCTERYTSARLLGLQRGGRNMTTEEVQAQLGGQGWGLLTHAAVTAAPETATRVALDVRIPKGGRDGGNYKTPVSGMGFVWHPRELKSANSACLSYAIWLPEDFKFAKGGVLPGLYGGADQIKKDEQQPEKFAVRMRWLRDGLLGVQRVTPNFTTGRARAIDEDWFRLERGRWINIEQEVQLNQPGEADGRLRIWIDGDLKYNKKGLVFRKKPGSPFKGVIADTHYADKTMAWKPAPKDTSIRMTPFLVRWN